MTYERLAIVWLALVLTVCGLALAQTLKKDREPTAAEKAMIKRGTKPGAFPMPPVDPKARKPRWTPMEHPKPKAWEDHLATPKVMSKRLYVTQRRVDRVEGAAASITVKQDSLEAICRETAEATARIERKVDRLIVQRNVQTATAETKK